MEDYLLKELFSNDSQVCVAFKKIPGVDWCSYFQGKRKF